MKYPIALLTLLGSVLMVVGAPIDSEITPREIVQPSDKLSFDFHPGPVGSSIKAIAKSKDQKRSADPLNTFRLKEEYAVEEENGSFDVPEGHSFD